MRSTEYIGFVIICLFDCHENNTSGTTSVVVVTCSGGHRLKSGQ